MENPESPAGAHVEAAHVTFVVAHAFRGHAFAKSRTDHHGVFRNYGRRLHPDFSGLQVRENLLVVMAFQIDHAVFSKRGDPLASLGVQANQPEAGRNVENALIHAVRPVRQTAPGKLPRRRAAALAFVLAVNPQQFTTLRVERDDRAPRARGRVKDTVHHERRSLEFVFRTIAKIVRLDAPGYLEVAEVRRVDLIERPVARARRVRGVGRPLRVFRMILRPGNRRSQTEHHHPAHQSQTPVPHHSRKHVGFLLNSGGHLERSPRCLTTARPSYAQV